MKIASVSCVDCFSAVLDRFENNDSHSEAMVQSFILSSSSFSLVTSVPCFSVPQLPDASQSRSRKSCNTTAEK